MKLDDSMASGDVSRGNSRAHLSRGLFGCYSGSTPQLIQGLLDLLAEKDTPALLLTRQHGTLSQHVAACKMVGNNQPRKLGMVYFSCSPYHSALVQMKGDGREMQNVISADMSVVPNFV